MEKIKTRIGFEIKHPKMLYSALLIVALCLFGAESNYFTIAILLGFVPLILNPEYLLGPVLFSNVWGAWFLVADGQTFARYLTLLFAFSVFLKVISVKQKIKVDFWFFTIVAAVALALATSAYGAWGYTSLPTSFALSMLLCFATIYCPIKSKELLLKQLWLFAIMGIIFAFWLVLRNGLDVFESGRLGAGLDEEMTANAVGKGICTFAALVFVHFLTNRFKGKVIHLTLLFVSVFLIFLTGSRNSLLALAITAIISLLYWLKLNSKRLIPVILLIAVILVGCYYLYNYLVEAFPSLMERFALSDVMEDGGSGRINVWSAYFKECFPKYWFVGMGFDPNNLIYDIQIINSVGHGAHNHIVDILASTGVVGLALFGAMHIKSYILSFKSIKRDTSAIIPFAIFTATLLLGIGENVLRGRMLWFATALVIVFYRLSRQQE